MKCYELEVKAKLDDSLKNKADQLTEDIVQQILNEHHSERHEEEIACETRHTQKVNELRMKYLQQGAMFHLKSQGC